MDVKGFITLSAGLSDIKLHDMGLRILLITKIRKL
jgi:hypothetical protein